MANQISIIIKAQDQASKQLDTVTDSVKKAGRQSEDSSKRVATLGEKTGALAGLAATAGVGVYSLSKVIGGATSSANSYQSALTGLSSIAAHFNISQDKAREAAQSLARDGLMTVSDAAIGLKNLLASGFSLDQAVTLMNRFKDSAAFGRQASLGFGQAIASATEGIKNGNSILVDNAGVTKNLSVMLTEAGLSANDLMNASSDASVRQAIFNGILKETAAQSGDAAKLSDQFAGSQAKLSAQTEVLQQRLGAALQPALLSLMDVVQPVIGQISSWIDKNPQLASGLIIGATLFMGLAAAIGAVGAALFLITPVIAVIGGPVLGAIVGIGAAVALVAGLIVTHWTQVRTFSLAVWTAIRDGATSAFAWVVDKVSWFKVNWATAIGFVIGAAATLPVRIPVYMYQAVSSMIGYVRNIDWGGVFASIGSGMSRAMDGVRNAASAALNYIQGLNWGGIVAGIGSGIGNSIIGMIEGAINGALSNIPGSPKVSIPRFASGTLYAPGGMALVGEHGPEYVNLPQGSQVTQAYRTRSMVQDGGGDGGGVTNNYLTGTFNFANADASNAFFDRIDKTQRLARKGLAS
ncbi:phage tail tape measure protein [Rhodococcus qingshengii]|uniref:phage tail tape measure protein n=1 Tax=Rhodococcus qingshengii TaxID=334542 RepID=UPI0029431C7E|nr:phage tail tape measure protein [Rhodococcus qingshengii]WOI85998.1 phage tail tape measure protein [Rhodococcus qingshengii]